METDRTDLKELLENPGESLSVEIKGWLDPSERRVQAKIIKAALALRNFGGGYLIFGLKDDTKPDTENALENIREKFHIDTIQGLISKYASEIFEVKVHFIEKDGQEYPIIEIPPGIKTPVAAKANLNNDGNCLIKMDTVYMRSLQSNGTTSTAKASWKDWEKIVETCFENREADIGRFLRRHLSGLKPEIIRHFASSISSRLEPTPTMEDKLKAYLLESEEKYKELISQRGLSCPDYGTWEIALFLEGNIPTDSATEDFLNRLNSSNPRYTGRPIWRPNMFSQDDEHNTFTSNGTWESIKIWRSENDLDYMRLDPRGKFYFRRFLQDDTRYDPPCSVIDFSLPVFRVAEAIAVGITFAQVMNCDPTTTQLAFAFKWSKLQNRKLSSWVNPRRFFSGSYIAHDNEALSFVKVPMDTPLSALGDYVNRVVQPLFEKFNGYQLEQEAVEAFTQDIIQRK